MVWRARAADGLKLLGATLGPLVTDATDQGFLGIHLGTGPATELAAIGITLEDYRQAGLQLSLIVLPDCAPAMGSLPGP